MKTKISLLIVGMTLLSIAGADFVEADNCPLYGPVATIRRAEELVNQYRSQGCTASRINDGTDSWYVEYCCNGEHEGGGNGGSGNGGGGAEQYSEQYAGNIEGANAVATVTYEKLYSYVSMAGKIQSNNFYYSFTADIYGDSGYGSLLAHSDNSRMRIQIVFTGSGTNEFTLIVNPIRDPNKYYFTRDGNGGGQVNNPPNAPTLTSPHNTTDYGVDASSVYFQWLNNGDPDGDEVGFYIQGYLWDSNSQQWKLLGEGQVNDTSILVSLPPNTLYAWRVFAVDWSKRSDPWFTASTWSVFTTN